MIQSCRFQILNLKPMCDIGSGAGFPGIPVKIAFPHVHMTLVEPLQKRCRFLNEVKTQLNLDNLDILNVRAEDLAKENVNVSTWSVRVRLLNYLFY